MTVDLQRKKHPHDSHNLRKAEHRRRSARNSQYRFDAAHQFDGRIQADYRQRHALIRQQSLFYNLLFRQSPQAFPRFAMGRRTIGAGAAATQNTAANMRNLRPPTLPM